MTNSFWGTYTPIKLTHPPLFATFVDSNIYWQTECENGTSSHSTNHPNCTSMGFDNGFCDWQTHASAGDSVPLSFASIKSVKDMIFLEILDPWPLVRHTEQNKPVSLLSAYSDGLSRIGI